MKRTLTILFLLSCVLFSTSSVAQKAKFHDVVKYDSVKKILSVSFISDIDSYSDFSIPVKYFSNNADFFDFDCTLGTIYPIITEVGNDGKEVSLLVEVKHKVKKQKGKLIVALLFHTNDPSSPTVQYKRQYNDPTN